MLEALCDLGIYFAPRATEVAPQEMWYTVGGAVSDLRMRCYCIWTGIIHGMKLDHFQGQNYFLLKNILREQF